MSTTLARGDGKTDDTTAIQSALDTAGKQGGNVVLLPRGEYLVGGSLRVPKDVTLQGICRAPNRGTGGNDFGSLLLATGGKGDPDGTPFISLEESGTLYGLAIFYPEQTRPEPPVEYPWTARQLSDNASLIDVILLNPWQGVDFGTVTGGRHYISGLYGQPLKIGLFIDRCFDVGRVEDVHFWPFWKADPKTSIYTANETTAIRIGRADWSTCLTVSSSGVRLASTLFKRQVEVRMSCSHNAVRTRASLEQSQPPSWRMAIRLMQVSPL